MIIADFIMNKKRYQNFEKAEFLTVNWAAIIAVAVGVAAGKFIPGIVPLNAVLGGALCYILLNPLMNKKAIASEQAA